MSRSLHEQWNQEFDEFVSNPDSPIRDTPAARYMYYKIRNMGMSPDFAENRVLQGRLFEPSESSWVWAYYTANDSDAHPQRTEENVVASNREHHRLLAYRDRKAPFSRVVLIMACVFLGIFLLIGINSDNWLTATLVTGGLFLMFMIRRIANSMNPSR